MFRLCLNLECTCLIKVTSLCFNLEWTRILLHSALIVKARVISNLTSQCFDLECTWYIKAWLSWRVHQTSHEMWDFLNSSGQEINHHNSGSWEASRQHKESYLTLQSYVHCRLKRTALHSRSYICCRENGWCDNVCMIIMTYPCREHERKNGQWVVEAWCST